MAFHRQKPNWMDDETLLVTLVNERKEIIMGKFSEKVTAQKKREAWEEIVNKISALQWYVWKIIHICNYLLS